MNSWTWLVAVAIATIGATSGAIAQVASPQAAGQPPAPADVFALAIAICQLLTPIIVLVLAYFQAKAKSAAENTNQHVRELAHSVNSVKDELVAATKRGAFAEGHEQGKKDQKAEADAAAVAKRLGVVGPSGPQGETGATGATGPKGDKE